MIEVTAFTWSWLCPTLIWLAVALPCFLVIKLKGYMLELAAIFPAAIMYASTVIYLLYMFIWVIRNWDRIHIIPQIFKIVN